MSYKLFVAGSIRGGTDFIRLILAADSKSVSSPCGHSQLLLIFCPMLGKCSVEKFCGPSLVFIALCVVVLRP